MIAGAGPRHRESADPIRRTSLAAGQARPRIRPKPATVRHAAAGVTRMLVGRRGDPGGPGQPGRWTGEAGDPAGAPQQFAGGARRRPGVRSGRRKPGSGRLASWIGEDGDPAGAQDPDRRAAAGERVFGTDDPEAMWARASWLAQPPARRSGRSERPVGRAAGRLHPDARGPPGDPVKEPGRLASGGEAGDRRSAGPVRELLPPSSGCSAQITGEPGSRSVAAGPARPVTRPGHVTSSRRSCRPSSGSRAGSIRTPSGTGSAWRAGPGRRAIRPERGTSSPCCCPPASGCSVRTTRMRGPAPRSQPWPVQASELPGQEATASSPEVRRGDAATGPGPRRRSRPAGAAARCPTRPACPPGPAG